MDYDKAQRTGELLLDMAIAKAAKAGILSMETPMANWRSTASRPTDYSHARWFKALVDDVGEKPAFALACEAEAQVAIAEQRRHRFVTRKELGDFLRGYGEVGPAVLQYVADQQEMLGKGYSLEALMLSVSRPH